VKGFAHCAFQVVGFRVQEFIPGESGLTAAAAFEGSDPTSHRMASKGKERVGGSQYETLGQEL